MSAETQHALASRHRCLPIGWRVVSWLLPAMAVILAVTNTFHWMPFGFVLLSQQFAYLMLAFLLPLCFLWIPATRRDSDRRRVPFYDVLLMLICVGVPSYFAYHVMQVIKGWGVGAPPLETALSAILWLAVIEAGRRGAGPVFAGIVALFSVYPLFSSNIPGILWSPSVPLHRLISFHVISTDSLMGITMQTFVDLLVGFMVFAMVVQALGAGDFFNNLALAIAGRTRAGMAKVSVLSSALIGTISGSPTANVFIGGTFTIPAMKRDGMPPAMAAAIETVASTGGILMPPIMGVVAFIMAEFLQVPYVDVAKAATIPAIMYYLALYAHIDAWAVRNRMRRTTMQIDVPPVWRTLVRNFHIIGAIVVLLLVLFFLRLEVRGAWMACVALIGLGIFRKETRPGRHTLRSFALFLESLGRILGGLAGVIAPVGLIIGAFVVTGLAYSLPDTIISASGGNVFLLLLMGAFAAFVLGTEVPIAAVYIFLALTLAPALVKVGFDPIAAHLFVVYNALHACYTPPVAVTAAAAASVAGASYMKTAWYATRLAVVKYVVPFIFVLSPALILRGTPMEILMIVPPALIGCVIIAGGIEGYLWRVGELTVPSRILVSVAGLLIALPGLQTGLWGLAILVVVLGSYYLLRWRKNPLARMVCCPLVDS